jgi:membrane associated rhomboid family serine protease
VFPIRDDNPHFITPYVTGGLIVANVIVWLLYQGLGFEPAFSRSICSLGMIPAELTGAAAPGTRVTLAHGMVCQLGPGRDWAHLATYMFLHGSWFHILFNMWFLWIFGNNVEDSMGHLRFALFYLVCGILAAVLQVLTATSSTLPMVGASGAIGGVMGAYVLLYPRVNVHLLILAGFFVTTIAVPAVWMLGYWFLLQLVGGLVSDSAQGGVAFWAHVGGFVAGAALIPLFRRAEYVARHPYHGWRPRATATRSWRRIR